MEKQLWLGVVISVFMLLLMRYRRAPIALVAVIVGIITGQVLGIAPPFPHLDFGLHLPQLVVPSWTQIVHGTQNAVLPQAPTGVPQARSVRPSCSRH